MSETGITPMAIQRNEFDVAMELIQLYYKNRPIASVDELRETFLKFYTAAAAADHASFEDLRQYLPQNLQKLADEE